jgi:hypothetical protein
VTWLRTRIAARPASAKDNRRTRIPTPEPLAVHNLGDASTFKEAPKAEGPPQEEQLFDFE